MKKYIGLTAAFLLTSTILAGCFGEEKEEKAPNEKTQETEKVKEAKEKKEETKKEPAKEVKKGEFSLDRVTELKDDDIQLAFGAAMLSRTKGYITVTEEELGANYIFISTGMKNKKEVQNFRYIVGSVDTNKKGKNTLYLTKEKIDPKAEKDSFESLNVSVYKVEGDTDNIAKVIFEKEELLLIDEDGLTLSIEVDTEDSKNGMLYNEDGLGEGVSMLGSGEITKEGKKAIEIDGKELKVKKEVQEEAAKLKKGEIVQYILVNEGNEDEVLNIAAEKDLPKKKIGATFVTADHFDLEVTSNGKSVIYDLSFDSREILEELNLKKGDYIAIKLEEDLFGDEKITNIIKKEKPKK